MGFIFRDNASSIRYAAYKGIPGKHSVEDVELCALHEGLSLAFELGFSHVVMEGDSLAAYQRIQNDDFSELGGWRIPSRILLDGLLI